MKFCVSFTELIIIIKVYGHQNDSRMRHGPVVCGCCSFLFLLALPSDNLPGYFQQSLNFVPVRNAHQGPVVYITNTNPIAVLDASSPASRIVYFAKRSSYMEQIF
ncbi:hypothetical protein AHF37_02719 [Paragonimus kellicotti]|nr:hypothetical protein AHF37_02719 [Paragonimus kellicotti]